MAPHLKSTGQRSSPLYAWPAYLLCAQGVLLIALGITGAVRNWHAPLTGTPEIYVLGFQMNLAHSVVVLVTGFLALAAMFWRTMLRKYLIAQLVVYLVLFLYGTAESAGSPRETFLNLNSADNFLHAGLCAFALILWLLIALSPDRED